MIQLAYIDGRRDVLNHVPLAGRFTRRFPFARASLLASSELHKKLR